MKHTTLAIGFLLAGRLVGPRGTSSAARAGFLLRVYFDGGRVN